MARPKKFGGNRGPLSGKTEVRKIKPPAPNKPQLKKQEKAEKSENARIRHAMFGSELGENPRGVTILTARGGGVPQKPSVVSKKGKR
jgi:hypothetical protein